MKSVTLHLPYPPPTNRMWRNWNGRMVLSAEARAYKALVSTLAAKTGGPLEGDVQVTVWIFRPRRAGDLDGRLKVALDALQGVAYLDDSQVVELHAYRRDDKAKPRIEVMVSHARVDFHG